MKNMRLPIIIMSISFGLLFVTIIVLALIEKSSNNPNSNSSTVVNNTLTTYIAPDPNEQPQADKALIQGTLCPDSSSVIPPGLIVAEQIPSRQKTTKYFPGSTATAINQYSLQVDPGTYEIYLQSPNQEKIA